MAEEETIDLTLHRTTKEVLACVHGSLLLGAVMRLRQTLSQPTAKAIHTALVAEGGVRYPIADGIAEVRQVSLAAVKKACARAHRIENGEEEYGEQETPPQDKHKYVMTGGSITIAQADLMSEIAAHLQDTRTLASLSRAGKLAFEATASERARLKGPAEAKQREERENREWKIVMEARHGKATPENMCPRKCPKCAEVNSWRLTFRGPFGPDMDMYADCQCSNPKCRHMWEAEA